MAAAESGNWMYQDFYLQQPKERSVWTRPRALRNLSPQPVPLIYAFQEPAKFLYIGFPVPWGSTGVKETPVSTNDGMNFSSEKGTLFFWKLQKAIFACVSSAPASPRWKNVQQGQKIFYVYIQPKHKYTQVEHSSLAGWQNKVVFHGSPSLPHQREYSVPFFSGVSATGLSCKIQSKTWIFQAQLADLAQTSNKTKWKVCLHHREISKFGNSPDIFRDLCISLRQSSRQEVLEITPEWSYRDIAEPFLN